jgi:hypothetical protein
MQPLRWSPAKNAGLKVEWGIGLEEILVAVETRALIEVVRHPNPNRYPRQRVMVVGVAGYACLVPLVEEDDELRIQGTEGGRAPERWRQDRSRRQD